MTSQVTYICSRSGAWTTTEVLGVCFAAVLHFFTQIPAALVHWGSAYCPGVRPCAHRSRRHSVPPCIQLQLCLFLACSLFCTAARACTRTYAHRTSLCSSAIQALYKLHNTNDCKPDCYDSIPRCCNANSIPVPNSCKKLKLNPEPMSLTRDDGDKQSAGRASRQGGAPAPLHL